MTRRTGLPPRHLTAVSSRNADAQALRKARGLPGSPASQEGTVPQPHVPSFLMASAPAPAPRQPDEAPQPAPSPSLQLQPSERTREELIAEAAYLRAAGRGFAPGHEWEDWLAAEKIVDARLAGKPPQ